MANIEANTEKYLDPKTLDRIKRIDVRARLVVEGFITGKHRSPYNGFAIEFATHREYAPGDDLRHIDWKVWSKTDRLLHQGIRRRDQPEMPHFVGLQQIDALRGVDRLE